MPPGERRIKEISKFFRFTPDFSYEGLRASFSDICHIQNPMALDIKRAPWDAIATQVASACKRNAKSIRFCLAKGEALHRLMSRDGTEFRFLPMRSGPHLPGGSSLTLWMDAVCIVGGLYRLPYIDLRSETGLDSPEARHLAASIQYRFAIEQSPDALEYDVRPALIRLSGTFATGYQAEFVRIPDDPFLTIDEIEGKLRSAHDDVLTVMASLDGKGRKQPPDEGLFAFG